MPFWDEWKAGAIDLIIPYRGGFLDWEALFIPQSEHRILITRLVTLMGSILNQEWDPRVGMVFSAFLLALSCLLVCSMIGAEGFLRRMAVLMLTLCFSLPFDHENLLWGDQSQMYALNLLALCVLVVALKKAPTGVTLLAAGSASLLSLVSMGAGLVAPAVAFCLSVIPCIRRRVTRNREKKLSGYEIALPLVFAGVTVLGLLLHRQAPFQGFTYAREWAVFLKAFEARLSWPLPPSLFSATVMSFPWIVVVGLWLVSRGREERALFAVGIGLWTMIGLGGLAHGRPNDVFPFDSKYYTLMSSLAVSSVVSTTTVFVISRQRGLLLLLCLGCSMATVVGFLSYGVKGVQGAQSNHYRRSHHDNHVRPFLATGNPEALRTTSFTELPYWNGAELADILDNPQLQPWLPAVLRNVLTERSDGVVREKARMGPVTQLVRAAMKSGIYLAVLGLFAQLVFLGLAIVSRAAERSAA